MSETTQNLHQIRALETELGYAVEIHRPGYKCIIMDKEWDVVHSTSNLENCLIWLQREKEDRERVQSI